MTHFLFLQNSVTLLWTHVWKCFGSFKTEPTFWSLLFFFVKHNLEYWLVVVFFVCFTIKVKNKFWSIKRLSVCFKFSWRKIGNYFSRHNIVIPYKTQQLYLHNIIWWLAPEITQASLVQKPNCSTISWFLYCYYPCAPSWMWCILWFSEIRCHSPVSHQLYIGPFGRATESLETSQRSENLDFNQIQTQGIQTIVKLV